MKVKKALLWCLLPALLLGCETAGPILAGVAAAGGGVALGLLLMDGSGKKKKTETGKEKKKEEKKEKQSSAEKAPIQGKPAPVVHRGRRAPRKVSGSAPPGARTLMGENAGSGRSVRGRPPRNSLPRDSGGRRMSGKPPPAAVPAGSGPRASVSAFLENAKKGMVQGILDSRNVFVPSARKAFTLAQEHGGNLPETGRVLEYEILSENVRGKEAQVSARVKSLEKGARTEQTSVFSLRLQEGTWCISSVASGQDKFDFGKIGEIGESLEKPGGLKGMPLTGGDSTPSEGFAPKEIAYPRRTGHDETRLGLGFSSLRFGHPSDYRISGFLFGARLTWLPKGANTEKFHLDLGIELAYPSFVLKTDRIDTDVLLDDEADAEKPLPAGAFDLSFVASRIRVSDYGFYEVETRIRGAFLSLEFEDVRFRHEGSTETHWGGVTGLFFRPSLTVLARRIAGPPTPLEYLEPFVGIGIHYMYADLELSGGSGETFGDIWLDLVLGVRGRWTKHVFGELSMTIGVNDFAFNLGAGLNF